MVFRSPVAMPDIPDIDLARFMLAQARKFGSKPAVIDAASERGLSYSAFADAVERVASALIRRGIGQTDVVALCSPNHLEYPVAFHGILLTGAAVTTINPLFNVTEMRHQLRDAGAAAVICAASTAVTTVEAAGLAGVSRVVTIGGRTDSESFDALLDEAPIVPAPAIQPSTDLAALLYTSATSGLPKGVMLTHRNLVTNILQAHAVERMQDDEVVLGVVPFYHVYGATLVMNMTLYAGATLVTLPEFALQPTLATIQKHRITTAFLVPPIVRTLATHPLVDNYDLSSLRHALSGAAPLPENVAAAFVDRTGCILKQGYGLTEASPVTHYTPRDRVKIASVGVAAPGTEFCIVDVATKQDCDPGVLGEVWVRGPQVMKGYHNNPDFTQRMIDPHGWLHTGDIGYADDDGYLYVMDRAKDLVKFRGLQYRDDELLLTMVEDSVARRDAEQRMRLQAFLLDSVTESIVVVNPQRHVTYWNKGAEALFGYTADEALLQPIENLIFPTDPEVEAQWQAELAFLTAHREWRGQTRRRRKTGEVFWTDTSVSVLANGKGMAGLIAIHRDITQLKANEEMLRDSGERLQNLAASLMNVREEERAVLARELHDELGQSLTRLNMDLCWLLGRLPKRLHTSRADTILPLVDGMLSTVQNLSSRLRPAILDDFGLEAAVEWQVEDFQHWSGCRCRLAMSLQNPAPDRDRDTTVFRILQEALTNVARHASATHVDVTLRSVQDAIDMVVEDNGRGISERDLKSPRSIGLLGMRERARAIGAALIVTTRRPHGTRVQLTIPCTIDR